MRTWRPAGPPAIRADAQNETLTNISKSVTRSAAFGRFSEGRLENDQTFQEADKRVLAVRVVIDNSLSNYFQFKVGDCGRQHLVARIHVAGAYHSAKTDHLRLLIERH